MKMMNSFDKQLGVTLLEVLVGFVIFTSSLVAVLDYVSGQIYHSHLSSANLQKVQMVYDFSTFIEPGSDGSPIQSAGYDGFNFTIVSSEMDSSSEGGGDLLLNRYDYSVSDNNNSFAWAVIKVN